MNHRYWLAVATVWMVVGLAGVASAQRPLPTGEDATTELDVARRTFDWLQPLLLESYRQHGDRDEAWDGAAEELLRAYARWLVPAEDWRWEKPDPETLLADARALIDEGCRDPLVYQVLGQMAHELEEGDVARHNLAQAVIDHEDHDHHAVLRALASAHLAVAAERSHGRESRRAVELAVEAFSADDVGEEHQQALHHVLFQSAIRQMSQESLFRLNEQLSAVERRIDPWQYRVIRGRAHKDLAWQARTGALARDVTPEQWRRFEQDMERARDFLTEAHRLHPDRPEAATEMISIANAWPAERRTPRAWFDEAVAAQLDYAPAYAALRGALLPRWGGSHEAMLDFARECVATGRYDTLVPFQAHEMLLAFRFDLDGSYARVAENFDPLYDVLDEMLQGYIETDGPRRGEFLTRRVALAWRFGRHETGYELLQALADDPADEHLTPYGGQPEQIRSELMALGGPAGETLQAAEDARRRGDLGEAHKLLAGLLEEHDDPPALAEFIRHRLELVTLQRDFEAGAHVELPHALTAGWRIETGRWSTREDGAFEGYHTDSSKLVIHELPLPRRFEFSGEAGFTEYRNHSGYVNGPAIMADGVPYPLWLQTSMAGGTSVRQFTQLVTARSPAQQTYRFRLAVYGDRLVYEINGQRILDSTELLDNLPGELHVGVGGRYGHDTVGVVFRDLRLRRLEEEPGEPVDFSQPLDEPILHYDFTHAPVDERRLIDNRGVYALPLTVEADRLEAIGATRALRAEDDLDVDTFFQQDLERWTVSAWTRADAAPADGDPQAVVHYYPFAMMWDHFHEPARGGMELRIGGEWRHASFGDLEGERWHHLVGVFDGDTLRAYRDGELITEEDELSGELDAPTRTLRIGRHPEHAGFNGHIAEVRLYNRPLDEDEVRQLLEDRPANLPE